MATEPRLSEPAAPAGLPANASLGAPAGAAALLRNWHRAECWLAMAAFSLIALLAIYDVLARELLGPLLKAAGLKPTLAVITGSAKIAVYALIVGAFAGVGIATATGVQLVPKIAFKWVPPAWGPAVDRLADALTAAFLLGVAFVAWQFVASSKASGMLTSGGIELPAWVIQSIIPIGFASAALRYAVFARWPALRPQPPQFQE